MAIETGKRPNCAGETEHGKATQGWSPESVVSAIRHSLGLVALSHTPYFADLFDPALIDRIRHPAEMDFDRAAVARPWQINAAGKRYFVPGSAADLISYTSCVVSCCPQIRRAWALSGPDEDCGPPEMEELERSRVGEHPWKYYWNNLHHRSEYLVDAGYPWVFNADIEKCAEKIVAVVIAGLLSE